MTETAIKSNKGSPLLRWLVSAAISIAVTAIIVVVAFGDRMDGYVEAVSRLNIRPQTPDLAPILAAAPVIQLHLLSALTALAIGIILLAGVKGTTMHRTLGWAWVSAMAATAVSSLFIRELNGGAFSFIHLLTGWTIIVLPMAVFMARRHKVRQHQRMMTGLFVGGLIVAGMFAFMPGRILFSVFFSM